MIWWIVLLTVSVIIFFVLVQYALPKLFFHVNVDRVWKIITFCAENIYKKIANIFRRKNRADKSSSNTTKNTTESNSISEAEYSSSSTQKAAENTSYSQIAADSTHNSQIALESMNNSQKAAENKSYGQIVIDSTSKSEVVIENKNNSEIILENTNNSEILNTNNSEVALENINSSEIAMEIEKERLLRERSSDTFSSASRQGIVEKVGGIIVNLFRRMGQKRLKIIKEAEDDGLGRGICNFYAMKSNRNVMMNANFMDKQAVVRQGVCYDFSTEIIHGNSITNAAEATEFVRMASEAERGVLYETKSKYQPYISQYLVFSQASKQKRAGGIRGTKGSEEVNYAMRGEDEGQAGGKKWVKCKLTTLMSRIDYDILLYDADDKLFDVINVREELEGNAFTSSVRIPSKTAYVGVIVNSAGNVMLRESPKKKNNVLRFALCSVLVMLVSILQVFAIRYCFAGMLGDVFFEDIIKSDTDLLIVFGILLGTTNCVTQLLHVKKARKGDA